MKGEIYYGGRPLNIERFPLLRHLSYILRHPYGEDLFELFFDKKTMSIQDHDGLNPLKIGDIQLDALEVSFSTSQDQAAILRYSQGSGRNLAGADIVSILDAIHVERLGLYIPAEGKKYVSETGKVVDIVRVDDLLRTKHIIDGQKKGIFPRYIKGYYGSTVPDPRPWLRHLLREFQRRTR